jgi:alpha-ketoglutarate-dependent taurine dioxygenase
MLAEKSGLATVDLTPVIGTEVKVDAETLLSGRFAPQIRALLEERGVLIFREVGLTDEQQVAFTKTLGVQQQEYYGAAIEGERKDVFKVSLDPKINPITAEALKTSFFWHLDGAMSEVPILASLLSSKKLSTTGGQTEFCNTYAAYEALPEADKKQLANLRVVHANWWRNNYSNPEPSHEEFKRARSGPSKEQPLVWTHRSGRKSLVIGLTAAYVVGMDPADSMELLVRLRDFATQPQFVYQHQWKVGDLIMWDNTGTLHRVLPYAVDSGRLMHRTMLQGEEPFA